MTTTYRGVAGLPTNTDAADVTVLYQKIIDGLRTGRTAVAKTSNATLALTDVGELVTCSGTFNLTVPTNASVAFSSSPVTIIPVINISTGVITIVPFDGTVIVQGSDLTLEQYEHGFLSKVATNTWIFSKTTRNTVKTTATQTLTNKTLTAPIIATINNGGTITIPSGTDTLVGRATTDTLTNKTLSSPTVTGTVTATGSTRSGGTVNADTLQQGGVQAVTVSGTQTLTNKTLTAPIISTISNTGTLTLPTSTDTLVGRATTDTLTNKTLTSPTINTPTISTPAITGGTWTNPTLSGTITGLPPADWTIVAKTAAYTAAGSDDNKLITMTAATTQNITLPSDANDATMPVGATITVAKLGAGDTSFVAGSGATVYGTPGTKLRAQYSIASAIKIAANTYLVSGDVIA